MTDRWLSVEEIAAYLGVSRDTVYAWINKRNMPAHRLVDSGNLNPMKSTNGFDRLVQQIRNIGKGNEGLGFRLFRSSLDTGRRDLM
ncbi:excisionase family DNA-binding protein [Cupriavidus sp. YAF13]|uniref:excisionase family DNA-binding protein n=1 Tax=Cupriavidus sp. YAF13 TaxID=3233075 RepID=UPI003F90E1F2